MGENLGERFETPHGEQEWTYKWGEISAEGRHVAHWSDGLTDSTARAGGKAGSSKCVVSPGTTKEQQDQGMSERGWRGREVTAWMERKIM